MKSKLANPFYKIVFSTTFNNDVSQCFLVCCNLLFKLKIRLNCSLFKSSEKGEIAFEVWKIPIEIIVKQNILFLFLLINEKTSQVLVLNGTYLIKDKILQQQT